MPSYDYYCPANAQTLEVRHSINDLLTTWGELCTQAQVDPGDTPLDSPVQRRISGGVFISSVKTSTTAESAPAPNACCAHGRCGCA
jgi:hypothetical protein